MLPASQHREKPNRPDARGCDRCASAVQLVGRFGALRVITHVMTASSIPASGGGGYARYLESKTVTPERGDYYLTPDGEMAQAPGRWLAEEETLAALGVQAGEPVNGADFIALMDGRHPGTGRWLRPEGAGGGRGGGIDVTLSAPKSVSAVWALGDPWQREQIEAAHARAVEQTILYLREQVPVVRRRYGGQVVEEHAKDVIAAEYRHTTARGVAEPRHRTRSCTATSSSAALSVRTSASSRSPRGRSFVAHGSWVRSTAPSSRTSSQATATRSATGRGRMAATSSWLGYRTRCWKSSPGAAARLQGPPSVSVRATAARRSVGSCAAWRSRTDAPSSRQPGQTSSRHGPRPGAATASAPMRRCDCWRDPSASVAAGRRRTASRRT